MREPVEVPSGARAGCPMKSVRYMRHAIDVAWSTLLRACQNDSRAWRFLEEAEAIATKGERAHRTMGARFTHGQAGYRLPVHYAARLVILNHFCLGLRAPCSWAEQCSYRADCTLAYAVREIIDEFDDGAAIVAACKPAGEISYSEDVAA